MTRGQQPAAQGARGDVETDILVIGGGIIGMACAYELGGRGASVVLIDKGEISHGCSYGNAGWITPCFAKPLPMPGMLWKSVKWLFDPESPLYIRPTASIAVLRWLARFLFCMRESQMRRSVAALTEISTYSLDAYAALDREFPGAFSFERKGLLMVANTASGLRAVAGEMELVAAHGIPGRLMTTGEVREHEPALTGGMKFLTRIRFRIMPHTTIPAPCRRASPGCW